MIPSFYPITDRALSGGRTHASLVDLLCAGGATLIQMRDKEMTGRALLRAAREAVAAAHGRGARLVMNDRVDAALMAEADGAHLGQDDLPVDAARQLLPRGSLLGISTHSVREAIAADSLPVDYIALGPIFATTHAERLRPALGLEAVAEAARAVTLPIVAIGGINLDNAASVLSAGAASLAVMGDVMSASDIPARVSAYIALGRRPGVMGS